MIGFDRRHFLGAMGTLAAGAWALPANAQPFPTKPVMLVIPFAPGGPTDTMARLLATQLAIELKQPVISDNKGGAGGNVGAAIVARAAPDGYTLLIATNGPLAANAALFSELPFNPATDFDPVSLFTFLPNMLAVHPSVPAKNIQELVTYLKANPSLPYASGGVGTSSHFAGELFKKMAGVQMEHVPYRGDGQSVPDALAGNVKVIFCSILAGMNWTPSGKLRALAVTSAKRVPVVSDLPTVAEQGFPGFDLTAWYAIMVPAHTPKDVIHTLNAALVKAMSNTEIKAKIEGMGAIVESSTPEQLKEFIAAEVPRWTKLVKDLGIKL